MTDPIALRVGVALGCALLLALGAVLYLAVSLPRRVMRLVVMEWAATGHARSDKGALEVATRNEVATLVAALRAYHDEIGERARIAREITTAASAEEVASIVRDLRASAEEVASIVRDLGTLLTWLAALTDDLYVRAVHVDREARTGRGAELPAIASVPTSGPLDPPSTPSGGPTSDTMIGLGIPAPGGAEVEAHGPGSAPTQVSPLPAAKNATASTFSGSGAR
jgi:hypothetical protein